MNIKRIVLALVFLLSTNNYGQDVKISKKFFSADNQRVGIGVNFDMSWAGDEGKTGMMKSIGANINDDNIFYGKIPNMSFGLGLDYYSPKSILGFYAEVNYNKQEYSIRNPSFPAHDSLKISNIEIPIYVKFRFGSMNGHNHAWLALGAGYSMPSKVEMRSYNDNTNVLFNSSDDKKMVASMPYASVILGYELILPFSEANGQEEFDRDGFRIMFYTKINQDLGNRLNPDYNAGSLSNHVIETFSNRELKFRRISAGLKVLMRFKGAGDIVKEAIKKQKASF
jgi:hypothetical protein